MKNIGKGVISFVKNAINNPITTGLTIAGAIGLNVITGGAAMIPMLAIGATISAGSIGYGTYKYCSAQTDGEAKDAAQTIGSGLFGLVTSIFGAKTVLNAGAKAGVSSAQGARYKSPFGAFLQVFKATPEAVKQSCTNAKYNVNTMCSGVTSVLGKNKNVPTIPKEVSESVKQHGFEIKKGQTENFLKDLRLKPDEMGYKDVKKILTGLEKMHAENKVNIEEYTKLSSKIDPDLPGGYWNHAKYLYNKYAEKAYPPKLNDVVNEYISGIDTINGGILSYKLSPTKAITPIIPATVLTSTNE